MVCHAHVEFKRLLDRFAKGFGWHARLTARDIKIGANEKGKSDCD